MKKNGDFSYSGRALSPLFREPALSVELSDKRSLFFLPSNEYRGSWRLRCLLCSVGETIKFCLSTLAQTSMVEQTLRVEKWLGVVFCLPVVCFLPRQNTLRDVDSECSWRKVYVISDRMQIKLRRLFCLIQLAVPPDALPLWRRIRQETCWSC